MGTVVARQMPAHTGIAWDLYNWFLYLIHGGDGLSYVEISAGLGGAIVGTAASGTSVKILENVDHILPAVTVLNASSSSIRVGTHGTATFLLIAGSAYTWRWKNPHTAGLCYNDLGVSGLEIDVIS